jgi:hypothetical protein
VAILCCTSEGCNSDCSFCSSGASCSGGSPRCYYPCSCY